MLFTTRLREGIRRGRIRCSVRIWTRPKVKVGGRYRMDDGHIVVDSMAPITLSDVTYDLARESGFESVDDLLQIARHGSGDQMYLIRFHYLAPGAWDRPTGNASRQADMREGRSPMRVEASPKRHSPQRALWALFRAIVLRDRAKTSRLLAESPLLARLPLEAGATREGAGACYFKEIAHYVYAGDTALHVAAAAYQRDIAEELVSREANVSARNRRGAEPLHYATDGNPESATWDPNGQYAIVQFLIAAGADPNSADKSGVAPLHRAVRTRSSAAVRALLLNGADALRKNKSGSTPLHLAVQNTGRGGSGSDGDRPRGRGRGPSRRRGIPTPAGREE
jgi:hypothetical protein